MKKLLKIELERALKNKWFYICLLIGFAIVAKDIYSVAYNTRKYYYLYVNLSCHAEVRFTFSNDRCDNFFKVFFNLFFRTTYILHWV